MNSKDKIDALSLLSKLAAEERRLAEGTFLAPVIGGARVRVKMQGIVYELTVDDSTFQGWAILQMTAPGKATVMEAASPVLIGQYLKLFPRVRLIALGLSKNGWWALPASNADKRFNLDGPVPVHLVSGGNRFDTINTRFDGSTFWFESIDRRRDPTIARSLNQNLAQATPPDDLRCPGMVPNERLAYKMIWLAERGDLPEDDAQRISRALRHSGAELQGFWYRDAHAATIRFTVEGTQHTVMVRTDDLSILSAGICLTGRDRDFDLTSLVSVFREYGQDY